MNCWIQLSKVQLDLPWNVQVKNMLTHFLRRYEYWITYKRNIIFYVILYLIQYFTNSFWLQIVFANWYFNVKIFHIKTDSWHVFIYLVTYLVTNIQLIFPVEALFASILWGCLQMVVYHSKFNIIRSTTGTVAIYIS